MVLTGKFNTGNLFGVPKLRFFRGLTANPVKYHRGIVILPLMQKVLFIDGVHPLIPAELIAAGWICDFATDAGRDEILELVGGYTGIVIRSRIAIDREFLDKAIRLQFIARVGAGMESIDTEYAVRKRVLCLNSPEGNRDAVGEHAIGMLLSLMNHLNRADLEVKSGIWDREGNRGTEIKGKTVGIIGYGNMGSAFAQRLRGFEADVISWDKYKSGYSDGNTRETTLDELFASCDILSLHVPLTAETKYMVDGNFLDHFRKPLFLINTSRGPVVKTADLIAKLKSGKVLGAALDVLEYEDSSFERLSADPPEGMKYLMECDNVILSPHIAGWTVESRFKLARVLVDKIIRSFPE